MTQPPADSTPRAPDYPARPDRRPFIASMIALATLLFLSTATLLYYRSATMVEPSCVILIDAAAPLKGAEISVDSVVFAKPLKAVIGENDRYSIQFYVDPGGYDITVKMGDEVQYHTTVELTKSTGQKIDLTKLQPTTSPAGDHAM